MEFKFGFRAIELGRSPIFIDTAGNYGHWMKTIRTFKIAPCGKLDWMEHIIRVVISCMCTIIRVFGPLIWCHVSIQHKSQFFDPIMCCHINNQYHIISRHHINIFCLIRCCHIIDQCCHVINQCHIISQCHTSGLYPISKIMI